MMTKTKTTQVNTNSHRRIDPEDAMCIDYVPTCRVPAALVARTAAEYASDDRKELAFVEARIAAGFGGQPFIDAAHCLRIRIAATERRAATEGR